MQAAGQIPIINTNASVLAGGTVPGESIANVSFIKYFILCVYLVSIVL